VSARNGWGDSEGGRCFGSDKAAGGGGGPHVDTAPTLKAIFERGDVLTTVRGVGEDHENMGAGPRCTAVDWAMLDRRRQLEEGMVKGQCGASGSVATRGPLPSPMPTPGPLGIRGLSPQ
jgi:hypothetical protein